MLMLCLGILWNSIFMYKDMVVTDIQQYGTVISTFDVPLEEKYEPFVRDIYAQDEIATWKVDKKLETMFHCSDSRTVTIVIIKVTLTDQFYHVYKKRMVYTVLENLKTKIRDKYRGMIKEYFFDNVFHMTDDGREFKADLMVVYKYLKDMDEAKHCFKDELALIEQINHAN